MSWIRELLYRGRQAGPGRPVPVRAQLYVGPPVDMPLEHLVARRNRIREVLPQYPAKIARMKRKLGPAAALPLEQKYEEVKQQLAIYEARIEEKLDAARR